MLATIVTNLYAIVGAILLACLVAYLAWRNGRKARTAAACAKFRTEVLSTLAGLYPIPSNWPSRELAIRDVLREKFPNLQAAVCEFRPYLSPWTRRSFDLAWRHYRLGNDGREIDQQDYWQYVPLKGSSIIDGERFEYDQTNTYRAEFKKNVDRLLNFAAET